MRKVFRKKTEHCCELMQHYLDEKKVAIYYNPVFREYYIKQKSFPDGKQVIYNCPWCGYEFPESLINEYYDTLKREYNILYNSFFKKYYEALENFDEIDRELPEEFKSDEWWKKRGL